MSNKLSCQTWPAAAGKSYQTNRTPVDAGLAVKRVTMKTTECKTRWVPITLENIAESLNVPIWHTRKVFLGAAKIMREFAEKAGTGTCRGLTSEQWTAHARHAEREAVK